MSTRHKTHLLVTLGIDTHADVHVAAALDHLGRELGTSLVVCMLVMCSAATGGLQR